jgi:hypothetical protein
MIKIHRFISSILLPKTIGVRALKQLLKNSLILRVIAVLMFSASILLSMPTYAKDFPSKRLDAIVSTLEGAWAGQAVSINVKTGVEETEDIYFSIKRLGPAKMRVLYGDGTSFITSFEGDKIHDTYHDENGGQQKQIHTIYNFDAPDIDGNWRLASQDIINKPNGQIVVLRQIFKVHSSTYSFIGMTKTTTPGQTDRGFKVVSFAQVTRVRPSS